MKIYIQRAKQRFGPLRNLMILAATAATLAVGCNSATTTTEGEAEVEPEFVVDGWTCDEVAGCFGLEAGRRRQFVRRVGTKENVEDWVMTDVTPENGIVNIAQKGGPGSYRIQDGMLWLPMRGQLLPAIKFPAEAGASFEVTVDAGADNADGSATEATSDDALANKATEDTATEKVERVVTMTVTRLGVEVDHGGETLTGCMEHQASFDRGEGLNVTTIFCEGIGEVRQTIVIPTLPNPIAFELVAAR